MISERFPLPSLNFLNTSNQTCLVMACPFENKLLLIPPHYVESDDCPPRVRRSHEFDPHNPPEFRFDPRPPLPDSWSCCRPGRLPKKPNVPNLKVRQLADAYACRVSDGCHNRRKTFYQRWQTQLDSRPRMPNVDYSVYCCDNYVDMGVNNDFVKYDTYLPLRKGPREEAYETFLTMRNLGELYYEMDSDNSCGPEPYSVYQPPSPKIKERDTIGLYLNKRNRLYNEDGISRWNELIYRPEHKNFVEGATIFNSRIRPHRRDASFSTPPDCVTLSGGNDSPMKQLRDVKLAM